MTPAGWYRDPYGDPALLRWWDGHQWTQTTQPFGGGPQAPWDGAPTWAPPGGGPPPQEGAASGSGEPAARAEGNPEAAGPPARAEESPDTSDPAAQAEGGPHGSEPAAGDEGTPDPSGPAARTEDGPDASASAARAEGSSDATGPAPKAEEGVPGAAGPATQAWEGPGGGAQAWQGPGGGGPATQTWGGPGTAAAPPAWGQVGPGGAPAWPGAGPGQPSWPGSDPGQAGWPGAGPGQAAWPEAGPGQAGPGQAGWPGAGPGQAAPPPWAHPGPEARRSRGRLPLLIGGGAAVVIIITVVAVLLATNVFGGSDDKTGRSPVVATITDAQAGISYPRLGGTWRTETVTPSGTLGKLGFDQGETATVMADFQNGQPYLASVYSGISTDVSTDPLQTKAKTVFAALEPAAYPAHTRQDLASESHPVGGHDGWLLKVRLTFPQAGSQHWNFRTETAALVLVDRGNGQAPAEFYVSIPDSHKRQGDLDLLLTSLKVS